MSRAQGTIGAVMLHARALRPPMPPQTSASFPVPRPPSHGRMQDSDHRVIINDAWLAPSRTLARPRLTRGLCLRFGSCRGELYPNGKLTRPWCTIVRTLVGSGGAHWAAQHVLPSAGPLLSSPTPLEPLPLPLFSSPLPPAGPPSNPRSRQRPRPCTVIS